MEFLKRKNNTFFYGWPVLLAGTLITVAVTYYSYITIINENLLRLKYDSDDIIKLVQYRMGQYEDLLLQTRGFFLSSDDVTRKEFSKFIKNLEVDQRHPEIQAIGYGKQISKPELNQFYQEMRKDIPSFEIWPETLNDEFFPIIYVEPFHQVNQKTLGYDPLTERKRRTALQRALLTGSTSITGKIFLVQDDVRHPRPGLILYVPFFNQIPEYFYVAFRADSLFKSLFSSHVLPVDVEVFDGDEATKDSLIYDHDDVLRWEEDKTFQRTLEIFGKKFLIKFHPTLATKNKTSFHAPLIVFIIGMLFSFIIFRLFGAAKKSQSELKKALESRDEFISIASHELKTPITAIKLHTQMVKRNSAKFRDPEELRKFHKDHIDHTEVLTRRLERLVDDMLDISRIKAGRLTVFKELVDINDIVKEVVLRLKDQFKAIPGSTPDINYGLQTSGVWDKHRIDQVVTNLLTNALKYGDGKKITVTTTSTPTTVSIIVKDNGIGIAPEFHDKIFKRFDRGGIGSKGITGLGLGLYITQKIVELHSGTIRVQSEPGKGSTFTVELPKAS